MGTQGKAAYAGISSVDVARLLAEVNQEYVGNTVLELRVAPTRVGSGFVRFVVVAANYIGVSRTPRNTRAAIQKSWPNNAHKTLNGCLVGLLHELCGELERRRAHDAAATEEEEAPKVFSV